MTPTIKALQILSDKPYLTAKWFAQEMWPDSEKWKRSHNTGNGGCRGKGMWLAAGSFLAKLQKQGLVWVDFSNTAHHKTFCLSHKGNEILKEYYEQKKHPMDSRRRS